MNFDMAMDGRRRRGAITREIAYQKVILAVHMLTDVEGLACEASNAAIGRECGLSPRIVSRSLAEMRRRGIVEHFDSRDGLSVRKIILMDHPDAPALLDHIRRAYCCRIRERGRIHLEK